MKKTLLLLILLCSMAYATAVALTPKEKEWLEHNTIRMCIDPNRMPFEKFDKHGNYIGITADYFKIFEKELHTKIELVSTKSWSETLLYAQSRKCDILSLAMQTPARAKYLIFTRPYLKIPLVLATSSDVPFIDDFTLLDGKKYSRGIKQGS